MFSCVVFLFLFISKYFLVSPVIPFLIHYLFRIVFKVHIFENFPNFLWSPISVFSIVVKEDTLCDFNTYLIVLNPIQGIICGLIWRTFSVYLRKMCFLLLMEYSISCFLGLSGLWCFQNYCLLVFILSRCFIHYYLFIIYCLFIIYFFQREIA